MTDPASVPAEEFTPEKLKEMIAEYLEPGRVPRRIRIVHDTSDYFRVDYDDVLILAGRPYLIRNYEREGRFTIDEQPKFWVKRAIDLMDGSVKIIKMVFPERFRAKVGELSFDCVRSPKKEARILDLVRGHQDFMQGFSISDSAGNIIRIIDFIRGKTMADLIMDMGKNHEDYFYNHFPGIFNVFIRLVEAIKFLHDNGEKHGDIRRDHIIRNREDGVYKWIDFDFNYWHRENMFGYDIFGLGSVLIYLAGRGDVTLQQLNKEDRSLLERLDMDDMNIIFKNRVTNLGKIFPYIPEALNFVMMHFSLGAGVFYDDTVQFLEDLYEAREDLST